MKSYGGLFPRIVAPDNLGAAMLRAARGKRDRPTVAAFLQHADTELGALREELLSDRYVPRPYTQFRIMDPKPRTISCADFRDRVVHHALCAVIGPLMERRFVHDSYACRAGKGMHRAVLRAQEFCRRFGYYLKADIRKCYDSIDHEALLGVLLPMFREKRLRELLRRIVVHPVPGQRPGRGLPIGNLTSQWFANLYLDRLDHFVKDDLGVGGYVRYMDDFVLWDDSKERLHRAAAEVADFLACELRLSLKAEASRLAPTREGLPFLGLRVYPGLLRLQHGRRQRTLRLVRRRQAEFGAGSIGEEQLAASVGSSLGMLRSFGLERVLPVEALGERKPRARLGLRTVQARAHGSDRRSRSLDCGAARRFGMPRSGAPRPTAEASRSAPSESGAERTQSKGAPGRSRGVCLPATGQSQPWRRTT